MDPAAARTVLGVGPAAGADELRAAFRARLRATHPDLHGDDPTQQARAAQVVDAYRALVDAEPGDAEAVDADRVDLTGDGGPGAAVHGGVEVDGDTVSAELPAGDLFPYLVAVGDELGDVTYVDEDANLLEFVVQAVGYGTCSVVLSLQGRGLGTTEAWCTVEPLRGGPAPPADDVAALLAGALRRVLATGIG